MKSALFSLWGRPVHKAYTLLELLIGMAILVVLMTLSTPAIQALQGPGKMSTAAYEVAGVLQNARTYATANRTYVWVGFFEEEAGAPGTAGNGRILMSVVASRDGTEIYNENGDKAQIASDRLIQVGKLVKIENAHLGLFDLGTGADSSFAGRPTVDAAYGRYGEINLGTGSRPATTTRFPFQYPLGNGSPSYLFQKTLLFTPRGEAKVNGTYMMRPVVELGLQPARGGQVDSSSQNVAAVQISGILGAVKIYQP
ncbi:MAG: Tfp pilus assembly protein FimT/FimU [Chthoniobacteraceae bacterium]